MSVSIELSGKNINIVLPDNVKIELIHCPAADFMMGSGKREIGHMRHECLHQVTLTKDFYLGKFTITNSQMEAICKIEGDEEWEKAKKNYKDKSDFYFQKNEKENGNYPAPVWKYDVTRLCKLFYNLTNEILPIGYYFDLPSEAQWECACRAGSETGLYNGKNISITKGVCPNLDEIAWYKHNSDGTVHEVGQKKPNAWGFYDMIGNVWELTRSSFYPDYSEFAYRPETDPDFYSHKGYPTIVRGGSYKDEPWYCRSCMRGQGAGEARNYGVRIGLFYDKYKDPTVKK